MANKKNPPKRNTKPRPKPPRRPYRAPFPFFGSS